MTHYDQQQELVKIINSFRTNGRADEATRTRFIADSAAPCKEMQRNNPKEFDQLITLIFTAVKQMTSEGGRDSSHQDQMATLTALNILLDTRCMTPLNLSSCMNHVQLCLRDCDNMTAKFACSTFGKCIQVSAPTDVIRQLVSDAVARLGDTSGVRGIRRLVGLLMLIDVAAHLPLMLIPILGDFFEAIWTPLADPNPEIREKSVEAFRSVVTVLRSRPQQVQLELFGALFLRLRKTLALKNLDSLMGALLVFEPIFLGSVGVVTSKYVEGWSMVWCLRENTTQAIRVQAFNCIRVLVVYDALKFTQFNLSDVVNFALDNVSKESERAAAFNLLRDVVANVEPSDFDRHLDSTIVAIKMCFIATKRASQSPVWEALACLATICARSPSSNVEAHVASCIQPVFSWGLTSQLVEHLGHIITSSSPGTQAKLQESLLDMISITLCGLPFRQRSGGGKGASLVSSAPVAAPSAGSGAENPEQVLVALGALLEFDFSNSDLMGDFLRDSVVPFLDISDSSNVRRAAISTITKLLFPNNNISVARGIVVDQVIAKLLMVATADDDSKTRLTVLSHLTPKFYPYLAQNHYLPSLFSATVDEDSEVRMEGVTLLCHLVPLNPSHILPSLRKTLIGMVSGSFLNSSSVDDVVRDSVKTIGLLASCAPDLVATFGRIIMEALTHFMNKMSRHTIWTEDLLRCVGSLVEACGSSFPMDYAESTITKIIDLLSTLGFDPGAKDSRRECLLTLGHIIQYTEINNGLSLSGGGGDSGGGGSGGGGAATGNNGNSAGNAGGNVAGATGGSGGSTSIYAAYPSLFRLLLTSIRSTDEDEGVRLEALRVLGLCGALDPHRVSTLQLEKQGPGDARTIEEIAQFRLAADPDEMSRNVLLALGKVIDPLNSQLAANTDTLLRSAVSTLMTIVDGVPEGRHHAHFTIPSIVAALRIMPPSRLRSTIAVQMNHLIKRSSGSSSSKHVALVLSFLNENYDNEEVKNGDLCLIGLDLTVTMLNSCHAAMTPYLINVLPKALSLLRNNQGVTKDESRVAGVLSMLLTAGAGLQPFLESVVAKLLATISDTSSEPVKRNIVRTMCQLSRVLDFRHMSGSIIRRILKDLDNFYRTPPSPPKNHPYAVQCVTLLVMLMCQLQGEYAKFVPIAHRVLEAHGISTKQYSFMVSEILAGRTVSILSVVRSVDLTQMAKLSAELRVVVCQKIDTQIEVWNGADDSEQVKMELLSQDNLDVTSNGSMGRSMRSQSAGRSGVTAGGKIDEKETWEWMPMKEEKMTAVCDKVNASFLEEASKADWISWYQNLCLEVLQQSPLQVYRCVSTHYPPPSLAERAPSFVAEIFPSCFKMTWARGSQSLCNSFTRMFVQLLTAPDVPDEVLLPLLDLAEFMDANRYPLPIPASKFAVVAEAKGVLAKALRWKEVDYLQNPEGAAQDVITLYSKLNHSESAVGVLESSGNTSLKQMSLIKLGRFSEALQALQRDGVKLAQGLGTNPAPLKDTRPTASGHQIVQRRRGHTMSTMSDDSLSTICAEKNLAEDDELILAKVLCLSEIGEFNDVLNLWKQYYTNLQCSVNNSSIAFITKTGMESRANSTRSIGGSTSSASVPPTPTNRGSLNTQDRLSSTTGGIDLSSTLSTPRHVTVRRESVVHLTRTPSSLNASMVSSAPSPINTVADEFEDSLLPHLAPYATDAAIRLSQWDIVEIACPLIPKGSLEAYLTQAALNMHHKRWDESLTAIAEARKWLLDDISGLLSESYVRAYDRVVVAQQLSELEETVSVLCEEDSVRRAAKLQVVQATWDQRVGAMSTKVSHWKRIMGTRRLLRKPVDDITTRIAFVELCREQQSHRLEKFQLEELLGSSSPSKQLLLDPSSNPKVVLEYIKYLSQHGQLYNGGVYGTERELIEAMVGKLSGPAGTSNNNSLHAANHPLGGRFPLTLSSGQSVIFSQEVLEGSVNTATASQTLRQTQEPTIQTSGALLARLYSRMASSSSDAQDTADLYAKATEQDPTWYRGWHYWANANMALLERQSRFKGSKARSPARDDTTQVCMSAITGYIQSINLMGPRVSIFQDALRMLSLWAKFANDDAVLKHLDEELESVAVDTWLLVIPQIIARMDYGSDYSCSIVRKLLKKIGSAHPHVTVYPLIVCTSSEAGRRLTMANDLLAEMESEHPNVVADGRLMSTELTRMTNSTPQNEWWLALEDAAKAYFWRKSGSEMCDIMMPLHDRLESMIPCALIETEFDQRFGRVLHEAKGWLEMFRATGMTNCMETAWSLYETVHKQLGQWRERTTTMDLQYCSPKLFEIRDLAINAPETNSKIHRLVPRLKVMKSKQRPCRIETIITNGVVMPFLLKGGEDLRLDERVMQLFKLVNTLLATHTNTNKLLGFQIQRYSVTPLWNNVGIVGWVERCLTLEEVISTYRARRQVNKAMEFSMLVDNILPLVIGPFSMDHSHEHLSVIQKQEAFEYLLDHSAGHDIRKTLWTFCGDSETWLGHRTVYIRSMATMSITGYILGLGDRHPQNIMIQSHTGKIVHIDFGDCFEVAMKREKCPEKVPFRLTRMLVNAMEVCGVEGHFRSSADTIMTTLRENRGSVLAMLEAFLYDPLISMRLTAEQQDKQGVTSGAVVEKKLAPIDDASPESPNPPPQGLDNTSTYDLSGQLSPDSSKVEQEDTLAPVPLVGLLGGGAEEGDLTTPTGGTSKKGEAISDDATDIVQRLESKLKGRDFDPSYSKIPGISIAGGGNGASPVVGSSPTQFRGSNFVPHRRGHGVEMSPHDQVDRLIKEATNPMNLAQAYLGWHAFW